MLIVLKISNDIPAKLNQSSIIVLFVFMSSNLNEFCFHELSIAHSTWKYLQKPLFTLVVTNHQRRQERDNRNGDSSISTMFSTPICFLQMPWESVAYHCLHCVQLVNRTPYWHINPNWRYNSKWNQLMQLCSKCSSIVLLTGLQSTLYYLIWDIIYPKFPSIYILLCILHQRREKGGVVLLMWITGACPKGKDKLRPYLSE